MSSLKSIVLRIAVVIFAVEILVMFLLYLYKIELPILQAAMLDASFLTFFTAPIIYLWIIKPFIQKYINAEKALLKSHHELEKRVEERTKELLLATNEANAANKAKSEFLSRMSHELRTPMNAILGFAQLLEMDNTLTKDQNENVGFIFSSGNHLLRLIDDVLDLTKIEVGEINYNLVKTPCKVLLENTLQMISPIASQQGISITGNYSSCDPNLYLNTDPTRLKEVLLNLLSNAVKYNSKKGSITVTVESLESDRVKISVFDTGEGLSPEQISHMFEPFNRLGAELSSIEGTGIGLAISKRIIGLLGGEIGYTNTKDGGGSCFWIEIPSATAGDSTNEDDEKHVHLNQNNYTNSTNKQVLYIEDNLTNLRLVEYLIAKRPHLQFFSAMDPETALQLSRELLPDLILLDINLPYKNGYEVFKELAREESTKHIPVIAVSASVSELEQNKAKNSGFDAFITKPIDAKLFFQIIDNYVP